MRYCPHSVESIKSKAKLLKRYLSNPIMEAPALSLTDIQQVIARGLGYSTWAEMTTEIKRAPGELDTVMPDPAFLRFVNVLSSVVCRSQDLCAALIFRLGFYPDSPDLSISREKLPLSERALLFDILLDRLVEIDPNSIGCVTVRSRLLDLHRELFKEHSDEWQKWDARNGAFLRGIQWGQREILIEWVGSVINLIRQPDADLVKNTVDGTRYDPWRTRKHKSKMLEPARLVAPFERGEIPSKGLLVMSGHNLSGRTFSAILLTVANRRFDRAMFPTFLRLYNEPFSAGLPQGYLGEIRDMAEFGAIIKDAERQLVVVQLGAGWVESAYSRICESLKPHLGDKFDDWMGQHFIGGYHHDFFAHERVLMSRVTLWKGINARFDDASRKTITVDNRTQL